MDITKLGTQIEDIEFILLVMFAATEIGIDMFGKSRRNYQDTAANIAIAVGYQISNVMLGYAVAFAGLSFFGQFAPTKLEISIPTTVLAVAIADFIYYWEHRIEHQMRFFWAYHNVHHSSTDYNLTVAARLSWIETYILWIFYIPMALLGFDTWQIIIAVQITAVYQTWIHTQKIGKLGILEKIVNTPALHRVHHAANPRYIDQNFGGILIILHSSHTTGTVEDLPASWRSDPASPLGAREC